MDLTQHSGKDADSPHHRWAGILGTTVAMITMVLPLIMIAYYSPSKSNAEPLPKDTIFLPQSLD